MAYSGALHRLAKLSSQGADSVLASEGYVTLVYANDEHPADHTSVVRGVGEYFCSAALLGASLAALDPGRPRLALLVGNSTSARTVLTGAGWQVMSADALVPDVADSTGAPMRRFGRKLAVLAAPFSRALFIDADVLVVAGARQRERLQRLWAQAPDAELLATTDGARPSTSPTCFNSGMLLYRPSAARATSYARLLERAAAHRGGALAFRTTLVSGSGGSCPGYDQPFLNAVYAGAWSLLPPSLWSAVTTEKVMASQPLCRTCLQRLRDKCARVHRTRGYPEDSSGHATI